MRPVLGLPLLALSLAAQTAPPPPPPPVPAAAGAPAPGPTQPLELPSTLALPVRVDLAPLMKQVEAQVPLSPPNVETWTEIKGKPRMFFRFNLVREPLILFVKNDRATVHVYANYGLDVGLRTFGNHFTVVGSCGRSPEPPRRMLVELRTGLAVLPGWNVELRQTAFEVTPLNSCSITALGYDITDQVAAGVRDNLASGLDLLSRLVRENALIRQKAQEAWTLLSQPVELGPDLYLVFQPRHIRLAPPVTEGHTLVLTPEIEVQPRLVLGARPALAAAPLPDLETDAQPRPGFHLRVDADLSYEHASRQLAANLVGKVFNHPKGQFEVTSARVWGTNGRAFLEIGLKGRIEGKVTLTGRPESDPATGALRIADLDFTLESRSWMARLGDWVYHTDLKKLLVEKAQFLLEQQTQGLRDTVQAGLNRQLAGNLRLSGSLQELRVGPVETGPDGFHSQAALEGEVRMDLQ